MRSLTFKFIVIFTLVFLTSCVHQITLTRQMSDVAATGITVSNKTKTFKYSSSVPDIYEFTSKGHTFQFEINNSFEAQLKDLFNQKYPHNTGSSEIVKIQLISVKIDAKFVQSGTQAWLTGGATYIVTADLTFSVTMDGNTKSLSVSKELDTPIAPNSQDQALVEKAQKTAIESLLTLAIIKLNKYLDS